MPRGRSQKKKLDIVKLQVCAYLQACRCANTEQVPNQQALVPLLEAGLPSAASATGATRALTAGAIPRGTSVPHMYYIFSHMFPVSCSQVAGANCRRGKSPACAQWRAPSLPPPCNQHRNHTRTIHYVTIVGAARRLAKGSCSTIGLCIDLQPRFWRAPAPSTEPLATAESGQAQAVHTQEEHYLPAWRFTASRRLSSPSFKAAGVSGEVSYMG